MLQLMLLLLHKMHNLQYFRWIARREVRENPPNRHFCAAGGSAAATEMTQMQRMARSMPPPCKLCISLLYLQWFWAAN